MTMNERNFLLSTLVSMPAMLAAVEIQTWISIVSAVVLPVLFFCVGKGIDVYVQVYLKERRRRSNRRRDNEKE